MLERMSREMLTEKGNGFKEEESIKSLTLLKCALQLFVHHKLEIIITYYYSTALIILKDFAKCVLQFSV